MVNPKPTPTLSKCLKKSYSALGHQLMNYTSTTHQQWFLSVLQQAFLLQRILWLESLPYCCPVFPMWCSNAVIYQWHTHSTNRPLMWGWWVDEGSRSSFPFHITQSASHWVSELWQSNAVQEAWCLLCGESLPSLLSSYLKTLNGYANRELVFIHYLHSSHTSHQNMLNLLVMARCWLVPQHKNWVLPH